MSGHLFHGWISSIRMELMATEVKAQLKNLSVFCSSLQAYLTNNPVCKKNYAQRSIDPITLWYGHSYISLPSPLVASNFMERGLVNCTRNIRVGIGTWKRGSHKWGTLKWDVWCFKGKRLRMEGNSGKKKRAIMWTLNSHFLLEILHGSQWLQVTSLVLLYKSKTFLTYCPGMRIAFREDTECQYCKQINQTLFCHSLHKL